MGVKDATRFYQPIYTPYGVDSRFPYQRECADRYEPIRELAAKFKRPFSVLDIGSSYGYFDVRLMSDFDCTCVMVDKKFTFDILKINDCLDKSVVIFDHLSAAKLEALSRSEHFDIVLGLSVLHHFDDPERAYKAMRDLGWWTIFEIPGEGDVSAAFPEKHEGIRKLFHVEPSGWFDSHTGAKRPYYVLENKPSIFEQSIDAADRDAPTHSRYEIRCDFEQSWFVKDGVPKPFIPGMNLWNFERLGGVHPPKPAIERELERWKEHPDFQRWNFVVGFGITPIDEEAKDRVADETVPALR